MAEPKRHMDVPQGACFGTPFLPRADSSKETRLGPQSETTPQSQKVSPPAS
jgi:hypothetical protein